MLSECSIDDPALASPPYPDAPPAYSEHPPCSITKPDDSKADTYGFSPEVLAAISIFPTATWKTPSTYLNEQVELPHTTNPYSRFRVYEEEEQQDEAFKRFPWYKRLLR
jgi:hypothetical protein